MPTANTKNGSAIEPRMAREKTPHAPIQRPTSGVNQDQGLLLAQIPDLDPKTPPKVPEKRPDGRIISQALSIKVIFGVGLGLVIGAILPFVFSGKASRHEAPVSELPAWSNNGSSGGIGSASQNTASAWPASPTGTAAFPPQPAPTQSPAILFPQTPHTGDARPTALNEPPWSQPRSSAAPAMALPPAPNNYNPTVARTNPLDNRGEFRGLDRPVDPRNLQADNRSDPAGQYRSNDARYDYRASETNPVRHDIPANGYPGESRYGNVNNYPPVANQGSPLMPSSVPSPASDNPDARYSDPGVARFDGSISTPPVRTSYGPGSSN